MSTEHRGLQGALHLVPVSAGARAAAALPRAGAEGSAPCAAGERA
ncbi:hypothetical protein WME89_09795 [Sorangium sp. So ce321]